MRAMIFATRNIYRSAHSVDFMFIGQLQDDVHFKTAEDDVELVRNKETK